MAGIDPQMVETLLEATQGGKGGGGRHGRGEGLYAGDSRGPGGTGLDPQTEFDLHENNQAAASHFASLGREGMGPNTSLAATFAGNRRAARAEAYNNRIREQEGQLRLLDHAEKLGYRLGPSGQLEKEESGFQAGYESPPASTPESGFNPQGAF
jgi:hypothetical protein